MNETIVKLSKVIRKTIQSLRDQQKNTQDDELKILLSETIERLIETTGLITDIQNSYQTIVEERYTLLKKVMKYDEWSDDKSKYKSFRLDSGCTVMIDRTSKKPAYAKAWYCKHCYENKKKSQLQPVYQLITLRCPECNKEVWLSEIDERKYNKFYSNK